MNGTWGVYKVVGEASTPKGGGAPRKRWLVRWRVDGVQRKRTFVQKGHAETFRNLLVTAKVKGWSADGRGWPVDPDQATTALTTSITEIEVALTFEEYAERWYQIHRLTMEPKNRRGHRDNMRFAVDVLRYADNDPRLRLGHGRSAGGSILLPDLVADDVIRALSVRATTNRRTAAQNTRLINEAFAQGLTAVGLKPESASAATVRSFYITLAMIIRAAERSRLLHTDPLEGTSKSAPTPKPAKLSARVVPSIDEVFDLADAIAQLGPLMPDGRPAGERFRSLVLCGGTLGPRPGELTAHRPDWIDWGQPVMVRFHQSAGRIYDPEEGVAGLQLNALKHRDEDDWREIPALSDVADALRLHVERGYSTPAHTWTGVGGTAAIDWGNIKENYWRPACVKVFGGSDKPGLALMTPKSLRRAAITFWLDSGITPYLAAEWAGHSEDVSKRYYAGRASATYAREAGMLAEARDSATSIGMRHRPTG